MSHLAHTVAVRATGVDMFFGTPENRVIALKQADFEARRGELIMLVGPSGCGKTTLLSVIAGTLTPQAGTVEVFGQRLDGLGQEELTSFRRQHLGFVFQKANLIPFLTALENVQIALEVNDTAPKAARKRAPRKPVVVDRTTDFAQRVLTGEVIAGNTRLKAAQGLGMTEVPVWWFDGDDLAHRDR